MLRVLRKSAAVVATAGAVIVLLTLLVAVQGCGDSYRSVVKEIIADLQTVQDEVLGAADDEAPEGGTEGVSPQQQFIDALASLQGDAARMGAAVATAEDELSMLIPPDAASRDFHKDYLARLGAYAQGLSDYGRLLEYERAAIALLMEVLPDASATEGVWADVKVISQEGVDASNLGRLQSSAQEAETLLAGVIARWRDVVPPTEELTQVHRSVGDDLESFGTDIERLRLATSSAADSGSSTDLSELTVLCAFALDQLDFLAETVDAWWAVADAAYLDGAYGLAALQDKVDAVEATAEEL